MARSAKGFKGTAPLAQSHQLKTWESCLFSLDRRGRGRSQRSSSLPRNAPDVCTSSSKFCNCSAVTGPSTNSQSSADSCGFELAFESNEAILRVSTSSVNTGGDVAPVFCVCSAETDVLTSVSPQC
ncbi:uncharacterized [Tachysurus ichikawai]